MTNFADFINPDTIQLMSLGEKITISLFVTLLGMGITFVALVSIWAITALMSKIIKSFEDRAKVASATTTGVSGKPAEMTKPAVESIIAVDTVDLAENETLIAIISAAIAASLNTSMHNIVVRSIRPASDQSPAWARIGRTEQMSKRF